jgi:hypothetical protein
LFGNGLGKQHRLPPSTLQGVYAVMNQRAHAEHWARQHVSEPSELVGLYDRLTTLSFSTKAKKPSNVRAWIGGHGVASQGRFSTRKLFGPPLKKKHDEFTFFQFNPIESRAFSWSSNRSRGIPCRLGTLLGGLGLYFASFFSST